VAERSPLAAAGRARCPKVAGQPPLPQLAHPPRPQPAATTAHQRQSQADALLEAQLPGTISQSGYLWRE